MSTLLVIESYRVY